MELSSEEVEKLLRAGRVVKQVLKRAAEIVKPGARVVDICESLENLIYELGASPAFPCNVSINEVAAHYSSPADDQLEVPDGSLVKVDVGAHVDGYIADAAITLCFNPDFMELVEAAEKALEAAIQLMKPGVSIRRISSAIEGEIKRLGFKPISNLSGHLMRRYLLHGGKSIPNVATSYDAVVLEGEVYAVEPFATTGIGSVVDTDQVCIYSFIKVKGAKNRFEKKLLKKIKSKFRGLPFSERWLLDCGSLTQIRAALQNLASKGALHSYPVLKEAGGGLVAQAEHTVIVLRDGPLITTA
ncbi:MAG: type II methionyl aminopeptidase [archaeon GB-1867-005]|nr:type II methionyl aminopeptidase [Candidatus Culexmicrobium cathedralense]